MNKISEVNFTYSGSHLASYWCQNRHSIEGNFYQIKMKIKRYKDNIIKIKIKLNDKLLIFHLGMES